MAESSSQVTNLTQLRALAQHHLTEIEAEKACEYAQLSQAEAEIQRYAKVSSIERRRRAQPELFLQDTTSSLQVSAEQHQSPPACQQQQVPDDMGLKKDRFRPCNEILHRLKWDPELNIDNYVVGYLERFEGIKEMQASNWVRDFSDEDWIPMHRVRYVKRVRMSRPSAAVTDTGPDVGIVWDRDGRIDKFSRSAAVDGVSDISVTDDVLSIDSTSVEGGVAI